jgi:hypothetical protein
MNKHMDASPTLDEILAMPVHPMAERFPMWPADRLDDAARWRMTSKLLSVISNG